MPVTPSDVQQDMPRKMNPPPPPTKKKNKQAYHDAITQDATTRKDAFQEHEVRKTRK